MCEITDNGPPVQRPIPIAHSGVRTNWDKYYPDEHKRYGITLGKKGRPNTMSLVDVNTVLEIHRPQGQHHLLGRSMQYTLR